MTLPPYRTREFTSPGQVSVWSSITHWTAPLENVSFSGQYWKTR